jgi:TRAP-type C4-dicarboxylate transport system permease small subunit
MGVKWMVEKLGVPGTILAGLGAVALFAQMCLVTADVVGRYLFDSPITGVYEITEFMILIIIFSFLASTQAAKRHVHVDLLVNRLPGRLQWIVALINHIVCLLLMALMTWMAFQRALDLYRAGEASPNLGVPEYPFVLFLMLGAAVMCVEYLRDILRLVGRPGRDGQA